MSALLSRITLPVAILAAAIVIGLAYDGAVLVNHLQPAASQQTSKKADKAAKPDRSTPPGQAKKQHPCNHGFYVSQAAKAGKGADYVKQVAQSDLGKDGNCTAPLPSPKPATSSEPEED